ncbi:hypothetical protein HY990_07145 [Candidatus Micrarchaeota archaeon]|nr:hypothetical protein [Candidatus Micrarchaeota archaeon]
MSTTRMIREEDEKSALTGAVPRRSDQLGARVVVIRGQAEAEQRQFQMIITSAQFRSPNPSFTDREQQAILQTIYDLSHAGNFRSMYAQMRMEVFDAITPNSPPANSRLALLNAMRHCIDPNLGSQYTFDLTDELRDTILARLNQISV